MTVGSLDAVVRALNEARVRYLVVGGLAVVAHGYVRFTADVDLVLDLDDGNLRRALAALGAMGYRPRVPVALDDFLDPEHRATWSREKHMTVFSLHSPDHAATEIDLFVEAPFDFAAAYARCVRLEVAPDAFATFVALETQSRMTDSSEPQWEQGWDGHERAQLLRMARLSLAQKIQWLEEAQRTVHALERSRTALTASTRSATLRTP